MKRTLTARPFYLFSLSLAGLKALAGDYPEVRASCRMLRGCYKGQEEVALLIDAADFSDTLLQLVVEDDQESVLYVDSGRNGWLIPSEDIEILKLTNDPTECPHRLHLGAWHATTPRVAQLSDAWTRDEQGVYYICGGVA